VQSILRLLKAIAFVIIGWASILLAPPQSAQQLDGYIFRTVDEANQIELSNWIARVGIVFVTLLLSIDAVFERWCDIQYNKEIKKQ